MLSLSEERRLYQPKIPALLLHRPKSVVFQSENHSAVSPDIASLFPLTSPFSAVQAVQGTPSLKKGSAKIGVVFSGGPASGGHNVVAGIFDTLRQLGNGDQLIGFLGGPSAVISASFKELKAPEIDLYRNQGGFDLLGSGRAAIETPEQYKAVLSAVSKLKLDALIIIGGDDSNTIAANLAEYFLREKSPTCVIGVPKTIDGDIQNPYVPISFGFDTAAKIYSEMIGNLARDTLSSLKYFHFVKLMGRSSSHLTLECALKTHPNITLISEEKKSLKSVIQELADFVEKRAAQKTAYGVVLVPEGLFETMPDFAALFQELSRSSVDKFSPSLTATWQEIPERIQKQLLTERDPHGNVNLSIIDTEHLLIEAVQKELVKRGFKGSFQPLSHFYGYEGRCGHPSNFDANYSYALGCTAALLALHRFTAMMAYVNKLHEPFSEWVSGGVPFPSLLKLYEKAGVIKPVIDKAFINLQGAPFKRLQKHRLEWMEKSAYQNPGPIQFEGAPQITDTCPLILQ